MILLRRIALISAITLVTACAPDRAAAPPNGPEARPASAAVVLDGGTLGVPVSALLIVDGEVLGTFAELGADSVARIPLDRVTTVQVLRGDAALERHGRRGVDGVVLITNRPVRPNAP
jgi:hypothetical protein